MGGHTGVIGEVGEDPVSDGEMTRHGKYQRFNPVFFSSAATRDYLPVVCRYEH